MITHSKQRETEKYCGTCLLRPLRSVSHAFGLQLFSPCDCEDEIFSLCKYTISDKNYKLYQNVIESILWMVFLYNLTVLLDLDVKPICLEWQEVFDYNRVAEMCVCIMNLFPSVHFSCIKRKQISSLRRRGSYEDEGKFVEFIDKASIKIFSIFFVMLIMISLSVSLVFFPYFAKSGEIYALLCNVTYTIYLIEIAMQVGCVFAETILVKVIISERFKNLSACLDAMESDCELEIKTESVISEHYGIYESIMEANELFKNFFPTIYMSYVYLACLLAYVCLFVSEISAAMKMIFGTLSFVLVVLSAILAAHLSRFASVMYGNFTGIGRFSGSTLSIKHRMKILCFMKTFGGTPLGISMAGFFYIKRNFFIRGCHAYYSVFSTLLGFAEVEDKKKYCMIHANETTFFNTTTEPQEM